MDFKLADWADFIYEARPFVYLALGVYALASKSPDVIVLGLSLLLIFCGLLVLRMRFAKRKGASLESLYYESLPFLYMGVGLYALLFLNASKIAVGSGVVLMFCATKVFHWRIRNRRAVNSVVRHKQD